MVLRADARLRAELPSRQLYPRFQCMGKKSLIFFMSCFTGCGRRLNWQRHSTQAHRSRRAATHRAEFASRGVDSVNDQQVHDFLISAAASRDAQRDAIDRQYHADEAEVVQRLLAEARLEPAVQARVDQRAPALVQALRNRKAEQGLMEAFMQEDDLTSEEGVVPMCLAEALMSASAKVCFVRTCRGRPQQRRPASAV